MTSSTQHRPVHSGQQRGGVRDLAVPDLAVLSTDPPAPPTQPVPLPRPAPADVETVPADVETAPADVETVPVHVRTMPVDIGGGPVKRDRAALRSRFEPAAKPLDARQSRPRARTRPALRGRTAMPDRTLLRDRATLRRPRSGEPPVTDRPAGPAALRHGTAPVPRRRPRRMRTVGLAVLMFVVTGLWSGYQVRSAQSSLTAASGETAAVERQLATYQWTGAGAGLTRARLHAQDAAEVTDGRLWSLATHLPVLGDDATAIRRTAVALDDLMRSARPLEAALPRLTNGRDGQVDVPALQTVTATLPTVAAALTRSEASLQGTPAAGLLGPAAGDLARTRLQLAALRPAATSPTPVLGLLPAMLGTAGDRTWLVLLRQSDAAGPARTGRIGACAVVTTRDGAVTVRTARRRPDLPFGANLVAALGEQAGRTPDYTLVLDSSALAAVVQATGPIRLGSTTIDGASTSRYLQQDVFTRWPRAAQSDYVAARILGRALSRLGTSNLDWPELIRSLGEPSRTRQLQVWAGDRDVQTRLTDLSVAAGADAGEAGRVARLLTRPAA